MKRITEDEYGTILAQVRRKYLEKSSDFYDAVATAYIVFKEANIQSGMEQMMSELRNASADLPPEWKSMLGGNVEDFGEEVDKTAKSWIAWLQSYGRGEMANHPKVLMVQFKRMVNMYEIIRQSLELAEDLDDEMAEKVGTAIAYLQAVDYCQPQEYTTTTSNETYKSFDTRGLIGRLSSDGRHQALIYALLGVERTLDSPVAWLGLLKEQRT